MAPIVIPATGGLQFRTAEQLVPRGQWLELVNADLSAEGAFRKRKGYRELPLTVIASGAGAASTIDPDRAYALFYRGDELCLLAQERLYSWVESASGWADKGPWTPCDLTLGTICATPSDQFDPDIAPVGELAVVTWREAGGVYYAVVSTETRAVLVAPTLLSATGSRPRAMAMSTWAAVVWYDSATLSLRMRSWSAASPRVTLGGPITITCDSADPAYDLAREDDALIVALRSTGGQLRLLRINSSLAIEDDTVPPGVTSPTTSIALLAGLRRDQADASIHVAFLQSGTLNVHSVWFNEVFTQEGIERTITASTTSFRLSSAAHPDGRASNDEELRVLVAIEGTAAGGSINRLVEYATAEMSNGSDTSWALNGTTQRSVGLAAHAFGLNHGVYQPITLGEERTPCYLVQDMITLEIVARAYASGQAAGLLSSGVVPSSYADGLIGSFAVAFNTRFQAEDDPSEVFFPDQDIGLVQLDFTPRAVAPGVIGELAHHPTGGFMRVYDGQYPAENDFHTLPTIISATEAGGGGISAGTRTYSFQWEWPDALGRLHRSAPTEETVTVSGAGNSITFVVSTLRVTAKRSSDTNPVRLLVGSTINGNAAEFFRIDDVADPTLNDPDADTISFVATEDDAQITDNEPLDQSGDNPVLANDPTPASRFAAVARDRLWTGDPERPQAVRFSKPLADRTGIEFSPVQGVELDSDQPATGLATQHGTLYGFTQDTVSVWTGDGPDAADEGNPYPDPVRIPMLIGCDSQTTIVEAAGQVIYGSRRGPRTLAPDRQGAAPFGPVSELYDFEGQVITTAIYDPSTEELHLFDSGDELTGITRTLRLSVTTSRWTMDWRRQARDASRSLSGTVAFLRTDGVVCVAADSYADGTWQIPLLAATCWGRDGDSSLQPHLYEASITVFGKFLDTHTLVCQVAYDYDSFYVDATEVDPVRSDTERGALRSVPEWGDGTTWGDGGGWGIDGRSNTNVNARPTDRYQFRIQIDRIFQALKVRVFDRETGPTYSASMAITAIEIQVQRKGEILPLDKRRIY